MTYEFNPSDVVVTAGLLDSVAVSVEDLMEAWELLWRNDGYQSLNADLRAEIDFLFVYELQEDYGSAGSVRLVESATTLTVTRPMVETPSGAWALWREVHAILRSPLIKAHVGDVLLAARVTATPEDARSTIATYLEAADVAGISPYQAALSLARANSIARSRRMAEEARVRAAMRLRSAALSKDPKTSGPALTLLSALSVPPRDGEYGSTERDGIRARLTEVGESSFALVDEVGKNLARLAENAIELERVRRWQVGQYLIFADTADEGMRKMHYAQTAADLAHDYGLPDLRDEAVLMMQTMDQQLMGWKTLVAEAPISKNAFRAHLRKYRRARDWAHALTIFLSSKSPSGNHDENIRKAKDTASGSIRRLFTRTTYGSHGFPEFTNTDFIEEEIIRVETVTLSTTAIFLALELEYIRDRFSPPIPNRIADLIATRFSADMVLAKHFSQALSLHWEGRFSDSARLSIPLIENASRNLLLNLDEPLYRTQRGMSPGRFPAMDFYVEALSRRGLDPDWGRAVQVTLLSPGMNLRNLAAHGFLMEFSAEQSALVLRLAGLFCVMPTGTNQFDLESPPDVVRRRLRRRLGWVWR